MTLWRHQGSSTTPPSPRRRRETHCDHAIIEQVIAELRTARSRTPRRGKFTAVAAWLVLAALAFNLLRAAGCAASARHAKARWTTLRTHLITIPARIASSARRLVLHLPTEWPWSPPGKTSGRSPPPDRPAQTGPRKHPTVEKPGRPADRPTLHAQVRRTSAEIVNDSLRNHFRWIEAQSVVGGGILSVLDADGPRGAPMLPCPRRGRSLAEHASRSLGRVAQVAEQCHSSSSPRLPSGLSR